MSDDFTLSTAGMSARVAQQEVVANNLANVNTAGFKRDDVFHDILTETTVNAEDAIRQQIDFSQGALRKTDNALDFALSGSGFFTIQTEEGLAYTRNGHFQLDDTGQLVLAGAGRVMGEQGPIVLTGEIRVSEDGGIFQRNVLVDRFRIATFEEPYPLMKAGRSLFAPTEDAVPGIADETVAVRQGYLEESNVNALEEMVRMMTIYRYFEADQKAIQVQDEMLGRAANEIGKI